MTADPQPWLHESGSRHAEDYEAPPGVALAEVGLTEKNTEKEKDR